MWANYFNIHMFAFIKFFDDSLSEEDPSNFYMEREWRVAGVVNFKVSDISTIVVARGYKQRFLEKFPKLEGKTFEIQELIVQNEHGH